MRFQTIYVDMRPVLTKWLGFAAAILFLILILTSIRPDFEDAMNQFIAVYERQHRAAGNSSALEFWNACLGSASCWKGLIFSWRAPLLLKSFLLSGAIFGIFSAAYGMWWRPEVMANRDVRVNSTKVEESRISSPIPPGGSL